MISPNRPTFGHPPPGVDCRPRPAAYAVILRGGSVAAVRGRRGHWLPGGGARPGAAPEATVAREVREELGCAVRLIERLGAAAQFFHAPDDGCWYKITRTHRGACPLTENVSPAQPLTWESGALCCGIRVLHDYCDWGGPCPMSPPAAYPPLRASSSTSTARSCIAGIRWL